MTITLPKTLNGKPMTPERAEVIAKGIEGRIGRVVVDDVGDVKITREQLAEWAADAERAAERARW